MLILMKEGAHDQRHVAFAESGDLMEDFFSVRFATSDAKVMATYLEKAFGFREVACRGLETGAIFLACHVLRCNDIVLEVVSPLYCLEKDVPAPDSESDWEDEAPDAELQSLPLLLMDPWFVQMLEVPKFKAYMSGKQRNQLELLALLQEILTLEAVLRYVALHGAGVCDVAFKVSDVMLVFSRAVLNGALPVQEPTLQSDERGSVMVAVLGTPRLDLRHTIVQNINFTGPFLPHYASTSQNGSPPAYTPVGAARLLRVDHCVQNFSWNQMKKNATFYAACFGMTRFWSVDEKDVSTTKTGLNSVVMINSNGRVKMPINEPVKVKLRGQIEEFLDFHAGPGVQHLALQTEDIAACVQELTERGVVFNTMHAEYYEELQDRLAAADVRLIEDLGLLRHLNILVDFDPTTRYAHDSFHTCNYILQIFTRPLFDRPTFFFEIIQRRNHDGFGKGTFKGLFEAMERAQMLRGTLTE